MNTAILPTILRGTISGIPSKSYAHRQLICAALSNDETYIECELTSEDINATVRCLETLGARIYRDVNGFRVLPIVKANNKVVLDCGESGATLRFLMPVAASLGVEVTFFGRGRLPQRPIDVLIDALKSGGVEFASETLPLKMRGRIYNAEYTISGDVSSQFLSGMLMALPRCGGGKVMLSTKLESSSYVDVTIDTMKEFGVFVEKVDNNYIVQSNQYISPGRIKTELDWSNAAIFLAANVMGGDVRIAGLKGESFQPDRVIMDIVNRAKCEETLTVDVSESPDIAPVLSVIACARRGRTVITGIGRLRVKECDRAAAIVEMLQMFGATVMHDDEKIVIDSDGRLAGGGVYCENDHRMVMAATLAGVFSENPISIRCIDAVRKSYPTFFEDFYALGGLTYGF